MNDEPDILVLPDGGLPVPKAPTAPLRVPDLRATLYALLFTPLCFVPLYGALVWYGRFVGEPADAEDMAILHVLMAGSVMAALPVAALLSLITRRAHGWSQARQGAVAAVAGFVVAFGGTVILLGTMIAIGISG